MTAEDLDAVIRGFRDAAQRAAAAGFRAVEIHAAHGYLLHEFLSPVSNRRTDDYGGSFENRTRLLLQVTRRCARSGPSGCPCSSASARPIGCPDRRGISNRVLRSAQRLKAEGVDLIDCSSGGLALEQQIPLEPGYQVPFAARIRREAGIATGAVGLITTARHAEEIIHEGHADAVLIAAAIAARSLLAAACSARARPRGSGAVTISPGMVTRTQWERHDHFQGDVEPQQPREASREASGQARERNCNGSRRVSSWRTCEKGGISS